MTHRLVAGARLGGTERGARTTSTGREHRVAEGLSAAEVGKEIAEHHEHHADHARRDRWIAIFEAVLLSVVALLAAWSGYSAAKWGTESSLSLAHASAMRTKASLAEVQATQIRTLDSVSFNAAETAYTANDPRLFRLA